MLPWLKRLKSETVLPRILAVCGAICLVAWFYTARDDFRLNSDGSFVTLGMCIGFYSSSVVSMLVIWLLKPRRARDSSPVGDTTTGRNSRE